MSTYLDHLLITKGPRTGEKIILDNLPLTIGRMKPADVVIDVGSISRNHARISRTAAGYSIEDLGSSNGTFVNSKRIQATQPISDKDAINLGSDVELRLVIASVENANVTIVENPGDSNKTAMMDSSDIPGKVPAAGAPAASNKTAMMEAPSAPV